jgi:hypothetical protein
MRLLPPLQWALGALFALLLATPACEEKASKDTSADEDDDERDDEDESNSASEKGAKKSKNDKGKKDKGKRGEAGLAHPDNDEEIVALAKAALGCDWGTSGFKSDCEALKEWSKSDAFKDGKSEVTLLNLLEDENEKVRWLAARPLSSHVTGWRKDSAAAKRLLAAAKAEKDDLVVASLGGLVARIDVGATKLDGDIKDILAKSKNQTLRKNIAESVLFNNRKEGGFYDLLQKMAREEKDKDVRKAAAGAFWVGGSDRPGETCKLWLELAGDADGDLAGHSAYHAAWWSADGGCKGQWDALLDTIDKRGKAGTVTSTFMTSALSWLQEQKQASDAQKKRALKVAETIVSNEANQATIRSDALRIIGERDPGAKAIATKFKDDKEFFVKSTAERIIKGEIKLKSG